jgi:hypothetical protein
VVLTAFASPRALPPASLRAHVPASVPVAVAGSVGEALALAEEAEPRCPVLCVAGSLALVGDALRHLDGRDYPCPVEKPAASMGPLF